MSVISDLKVGEIWDGKMHYSSGRYGATLRLADSLDIPVVRQQTGMVETRFQPLVIRALSPPGSWYLKENLNPNNGSLVLQFLFGRTAVLLTGDAEHEAESLQLQFGGMLQADLLKLGHHGSVTSSSADYLEAVQASQAVISVGRKNKFRHPSEVTLQKCEALDLDLARTDEEGAMIFRSNGKRWQRVYWRK